MLNNVSNTPATESMFSDHPTAEVEFLFSTHKETQMSKTSITPGRSETSPPTRPVRKQARENRYQTTNSRNQRKATARAYQRREAAEEKVNSNCSRQVSSLTSSSNVCSTFSVRSISCGVVPTEELARKNLEKKLSKIHEENSSKILAGNSRKIPAGNSSTILEERRRRCRSGEMPKMLAATTAGADGGNCNVTATTGTDCDEDKAIQIGAVDSPVESEHWTLTPASKWKKGEVQPAVSGKDSGDIQIQALTDASFKKVCVDSGAGRVCAQ